MTAMDTDDLAVVTGPLTILGKDKMDGERAVYLEHGEVVKVEEGEDVDGTVYVWGMHSGHHQYIDLSSLTPLSDIEDMDDIDWGRAEDSVIG